VPVRDVFENRFSRKNQLQEDLPMPTLRLLISATVALALWAMPQLTRAQNLTQSFSDGQRAEIESIIKNYLVAHPEVLEEAMAELNKRQAADEAAKHEASVTQNSQAIFNSPRGVVLGNKDGDVTFVEFFDYNCGYCKRAMADMLDLMKSDPKLKVVLKEFPVLSQGSVEAAQVAVAVRMQDPSGKKYLDFHQRLLGGRGPADKARALAAAKEAGLDVGRIEKDLTSPEVRATIEENFKLAEAMGMNGTPSYVIGKQIVVGAVGYDSLKEKIGVARCGKASC
jgi:protein-disulfide isomerase